MDNSEQTKQAARAAEDRAFVCEANGHTIKRYTRMNGDLFCASGQGFPTLDEALEWAANNRVQ